MRILKYIKLIANRIKVKQPNQREIIEACLFYDHSYGLMDKKQKELLEFEAKEWLHAWRKALNLYKNG